MFKLYVIHSIYDIIDQNISSENPHTGLKVTKLIQSLNQFFRKYFSKIPGIYYDYVKCDCENIF